MAPEVFVAAIAGLVGAETGGTWGRSSAGIEAPEIEDVEEHSRLRVLVIYLYGNRADRAGTGCPTRLTRYPKRPRRSLGTSGSQTPPWRRQS